GRPSRGRSAPAAHRVGRTWCATSDAAAPASGSAAATAQRRWRRGSGAACRCYTRGSVGWFVAKTRGLPGRRKEACQVKRSSYKPFLAQLKPLDLAGCCAWEVGDELDVSRIFMGRDRRFDKCL